MIQLYMLLIIPWLPKCVQLAHGSWKVLIN
jgi:hypothetical protein